MAMIDVFNQDAFSMVELSAAIDEMEYEPDYLGTLGIFEPVSIRTEFFSMEKRDNELVLVPTTPRGAALPQLSTRGRNMRVFQTVRIAKGDRLTASEISNIRAFGSETELVAVQDEVADRMGTIRSDIEATHELHRLGALQGKVLDIDGTVLFDWYALWGITPPPTLTFNFATLIDGNLREFLTKMIRAMVKRSKGAITARSRIVGLAGDNFYDALIKAKEVRDTYLGWAAAADLRNSGMPWEEFNFGGVTWINYRGTDDGTKIAIDADEVHFFPTDSRGVFKRFNSPGESFDMINTPGKDYYARTIVDDKRNEWVDIEVLSYPAYVLARPLAIQKGTLP